MTRTPQTSTRSSRYVSASAWILVAVGLLIAGVLGGMIVAGRSWAWVFPLAGFSGYVLAFRRGLLVWNPEGLDSIWRDAVEPRTRKSDNQPRIPGRSRIARREVRILRGDFPIRPAGGSPGAENRPS